jgi:hypothetical protein
MLHGWATFPGVTEIVEASVSFVHGISPSVATLTIKPQLNFIAEGGPLRFYFGSLYSSQVAVEFFDCKVDLNSLQRNNKGEVWQLGILDRRWKWQFGAISGFYNLREGEARTGEGEDVIKVGTEKSPQDLARLCFDAMEESDYDVSQLPNEARPEVQWDFEVPMEALAQLCDYLGCRVVLGLDNRIYIYRTGVGETLPLDGVLENSLTIDPPERPDSIAVVCGKTRFQVDLEVEAVGLDTDGQTKLIDNLSYIPANGWGSLDLPHCISVTSSKRARELAKRTVYRWYRIKVPAYVPGYGWIDNLDRIAIETEQVETVTENNIKRNRPALVYGVWCPEIGDYDNVASSLTPHSNDTEEDSAFRRSHSIDSKGKLVIFGQAIFRTTTPGTQITLAAAQLRLRVACNVREEESLAWVRYVWERNTGSNFGTQSRHIYHDEIVVDIVPEYNNSFGVTGVWHNRTVVQEECDYYLDGVESDYEQSLPQTVLYTGLRSDIGLDGAIHQIVYTITPEGTTTMVARNNEIPPDSLLSYKERRRIERQRHSDESRD